MTYVHYQIKPPYKAFRCESGGHALVNGHKPDRTIAVYADAVTAAYEATRLNSAWLEGYAARERVYNDKEQEAANG